tara:strand:- start:213 stop:512 length:300 start_codon:yes stop_codon:yes gene_type:complete
MTIYRIKDADGNVTNPGIQADETFMAANFDYYEVVVEPASTLSAEAIARMWRDEELIATDIASQTPDWPNRDNIITYRAALRDWPSTDNFPATKPVLGE